MLLKVYYLRGVLQMTNKYEIKGIGSVTQNVLMKLIGDMQEGHTIEVKKLSGKIKKEVTEVKNE